jgi:dienelactone hydrolase
LRRRGGLLAAAACAAAALVTAAPAAAFDTASELRNFTKVAERFSDWGAPAYQFDLFSVSARNFLGGLATQAADPERLFLTDLCWHNGQACAGDIRLDDWESGNRGIVEPVLYTARSGATISGHVWMTRRGPGRRPGIVITNGSVQAPEQAYWWAAQTLAKSGYVVLTWDPQGQGRSDTIGEGDDTLGGALSQFTGETFYDGTQDALDFLLSSRGDPYCPRPGRSGSSHCDKQERRVAAGRNAAWNPFGRSVDARHIGLAGHSFGARGVSVVSQRDKRVDAVVAWDNLADATADQSAKRLRAPALGFSNDYGLLPTPRSKAPDPLDKNAASLAFSEARVDTAQLNIRGGTHYEYSYIPMLPFAATLRGIDMASWYTTAWFDRYVKGERNADRRLLTRRWQRDGAGAAVDGTGDGNLFSDTLASRMDIRRRGRGRFRCEDMRAGCPGMRSKDGFGGDYSYLDVALRPDRRP